MTNTEGAANVAAPPAGSGRILDSTLLVSALTPGTLDDVARDSLLIAQREPPTAKTVPSWAGSVLDVFTELGWTCVQTNTQHLTFGESKLPWQKPATTKPWASMRTQLGSLLGGQMTIETIDAFVAGLAELPANDRARWAKNTVLGSLAVCAVAVAVPASDGVGLALTAGALTYDTTVKKPTLPAFPDEQVPSKGATLTVTDASLFLSASTAASVRDQLNDVVGAVLPSIIPVHPAS